jgi:hypothetical protein
VLFGPTQKRGPHIVRSIRIKSSHKIYEREISLVKEQPTLTPTVGLVAEAFGSPEPMIDASRVRPTLYPTKVPKHEPYDPSHPSHGIWTGSINRNLLHVYGSCAWKLRQMRCLGLMPTQCVACGYEILPETATPTHAPTKSTSTPTLSPTLAPTLAPTDSSCCKPPYAEHPFCDEKMVWLLANWDIAEW